MQDELRNLCPLLWWQRLELLDDFLCAHASQRCHRRSLSATPKSGQQPNSGAAPQRWGVRRGKMEHWSAGALGISRTSNRSRQAKQSSRRSRRCFRLRVSAVAPACAKPASAGEGRSAEALGGRQPLWRRRDARLRGRPRLRRRLRRGESHFVAAKARATIAGSECERAGCPFYFGGIGNQTRARRPRYYQRSSAPDSFLGLLRPVKRGEPSCGYSFYRFRRSQTAATAGLRWLHTIPLRILAARTVLCISIAIVIGPTPPGTGVSSEALAATASKSTSPTSR